MRLQLTILKINEAVEKVLLCQTEKVVLMRGVFTPGHQFVSNPFGLQNKVGFKIEINCQIGH